MTARERAQELVEQMNLPEMMSQLRHDAPGIDRLGIPAYNWWNEGLHGAARSGTATVFPQAIGLSALFDPEFLFSVADIISTEQRAKYNLYKGENDRDIYKGLTLWSPNVNIFRDPRWGRGQETFGEDPYLTTRLGVAFIKGLQGDTDILKTASCVKHLAAHSGPEPLRHGFNAVVNRKDLEETYLPAFEAAVKEAKVDAVMGAYSALNGEPCCASSFLMEKTLRDSWGFEGMYISDCWAIRDFHLNHKVTRNEEESAALALKRGCDLACGCEYQLLQKAFQKGLITQEHIKQAAVRVMTTRFKLGQFDQRTVYDSLGLESLDSEEHALTAFEASCRCLVLLKNDGLLPLKRDTTHTLAVIGPNADSRQALWGNYHGTSSRHVTILEGLKEHADIYTRILYSEGSSLNKNKVERLAKEDDRLSEAVFMAKASDVVVLCLGLNETVEGEMRDDGNGGFAGDKDDLRLPLCQRKLLSAVAQTGKPIIVVLLSGGSLDPEIEQYSNVKALIQGWYPGQEGGRAIAQLIYGVFSPSGKLPVTFYKADAELPSFTDYSMAKRTYRYCDEADVLYPFGFGLSYASFSFSLLGTKNREDGGVQVTALVCNTSTCRARTAVQLYLRMEHPDVPVHPFLCGLKSVLLQGREEKLVSFDLDAGQFTAVDEQGNRNPVVGPYTLYLGSSQPDARSSLLGADTIAALRCTR
ncbi:MAG TPA: glycoside hydrolase family 3 C-terminal domain-containing protein [Sphaerochaeta sp.]|nr:glycoside hydrolase family 3 C-terminal domain-containing protein [Sphaerochaeta sp.]